MVYPDPIGEQLEQIAWTWVTRGWERRGGIRPAKPQDFEATVAERRAGCLSLLRVYTGINKILQRRIDETVDAALYERASYGQVAAACGISRQAARQRRLRRIQREDEQDAIQGPGGPPDPGRDRAQADPAATPTPPISGTPVSPGPPPADRPRGGRVGRKVRVYELAKEFGVETTVVMTRLQGMGEFIRSASSTVDAPVVRRLTEEFSSQRTAMGISRKRGRPKR